MINAKNSGKYSSLNGSIVCFIYGAPMQAQKPVSSDMIRCREREPRS
jgi:hypothetical protein